MANITLPNNIENGQPGDAGPLMANFNALANFINSQVVHADGSVPLAGNWSADGNRITSLGDPVGEQDAASKNYVDVLVSDVIAGAVNASNISLGILAPAHGGTGRNNVWNTVTGVTPSPTAGQRLVTVASDGNLATNPNPLHVDYIPSLPGSKIGSGTVNVARLPVGTGSNQVAAGNHTHTTFGSLTLNGNLVLPQGGGSGGRLVFTGTSTGIRYADGRMEFRHGGSTAGYVDSQGSDGILVGARLFVSTLGGTTSNAGLASWRHAGSPANNRYEVLRFTSSERYKENIESLPADSLLTKVLALRPVSFTSKHEADGDDPLWGLIAEEVAEVLPLAVPLDEEGRPDSVSYDVVTVALLGAVQVLAERVEALEAHCACR